ncbi:MAG: Trm112 family protein [Hyphomicrobiaceae bacterium]|nr:Trm112 family protein [Hyphomicrobiaceae bacterium]MCC0024353.1 Trm112 family protein [Hyphomicrobiaceae bacterium]
MSETKPDSQKEPVPFDPRVMQMLVCPLTKTQLELDKERCELISHAARLAFPIRKGIPLLYVGEARHLTDEEVNARRHRAHEGETGDMSAE